MPCTSLELTSYRPGRGPVVVTIDEAAAAAALLRRTARGARSAEAGPASDRRTRGLAAAMSAVWRQRGVVDPDLVATLVERRTRRADPARDPFDPHVGKWAAIVLREDAADARQALAPLLEQRTAERVAFDLHGGEPGLVVIDRPAADKPFLWDEALRAATGKPPHHLLLVGGPERFPFAVVAWWSARYLLGMLDVADEPMGPLSWAAVHRYARKVRDRATGPSAIARRALVYAFRSDTATRRSYDKLATPLLHYLTQQISRLPAEARAPVRLLDGDATTRGLLDALGAERPALAFLCAHGLEYPPDPRQWGALTSVDYAAQGAALSALTLAEGEPFVEGGVAFAFACFSAGIPDKSALIELVSPAQDEPVLVPRIAPLPRIALGLERGPLAFIGHVDRASTSSFAGFDGPAAFADLADFVLGGLGTVGQGMSTFWEQAQRTAVELLSVVDPDAASTPQQVVAAWVRRLDSAGWLLLGDPCVRLFPGA